MSSITIRPATHDDIPEMLQVFFSAFSSSPLNKRCFPPSSPDVQAFQTSFLQTSIDDKNDNFMLVAEDKSQILGWARWARRENPLHGKKLDPSTFPASGDQATAVDFFQKNANATVKHVAGEKHWFLSTIATAKEA